MKTFKTISTALFIWGILSVAQAASGGGSIFYKLDSNTTVPAFFTVDQVSSSDDYLVAIGKVVSIDCQQKAVRYGFDTIEENWANVDFEIEEIVASKEASSEANMIGHVDIIKRACLMRGEKGEVIGYDGPPPAPIYKKGDRLVVVLESVSGMQEEELERGFPEGIMDGAYKLHASFFLPSESYPRSSEHYAADDRYSDSSPLLTMDFDEFRFAHPSDLKLNKTHCANKSKVGCADSVGQDVDNWTDRPLVSLSDTSHFKSSHASNVRTDLYGFKRYVNWLLVNGGYQEMMDKVRAMRDAGLAPRVSPNGR